jgi:hypothetical protein
VGHLQAYNARKVLERSMKSMMHDKATISVAPPSLYASRFMHFMQHQVGVCGPSTAARSCAVQPLVWVVRWSPKTDRNSCRQSDRHDCCGRLPLQVFPQSLPERYVPLHAFALSTSLMKGPLPQQSLEKAQALGLNLSGGASGCYHYLLAAALPASPHNVERHSSGLSLPAVLDGHED